MSAPLASLITLAALAATATLAPRSASANAVNAMIKQFCLAAVNAELAQAGKSAPAGMADFSCDCVVSKMGEGVDLDTAKTTCRKQAAARFSL